MIYLTAVLFLLTHACVHIQIPHNKKSISKHLQETVTCKNNNYSEIIFETFHLFPLCLMRTLSFDIFSKQPSFLFFYSFSQTPPPPSAQKERIKSSINRKLNKHTETVFKNQFVEQFCKRYELELHLYACFFLFLKLFTETNSALKMLVF